MKVLPTYFFMSKNMHLFLTKLSDQFLKHFKSGERDVSVDFSIKSVNDCDRNAPFLESLNFKQGG